MGSLSPEIVVLICIVGAAATATIGFAIHRLFSKESSQEDYFNQRSAEQEAYMREVRQRTQMRAFSDSRFGQHSGHEAR